LFKWWKFRNEIIHPKPRKKNEQDAIDKSNIEKLPELLKYICIRIGLTYKDEYRTKELEYVAGLPNVLPPNIEYMQILESDFDNFKALNEKRVGFQNRITQALETEKLAPEDISGFNLNTGSIWLPWVRQQDAEYYAEQSKSSGSKLRTRTFKASLGIVFSPCNIRIGLDFGGYAYESKEKYYRLLLENKFREELELLYSTNKGYTFYDTYWFYYLRNPANYRGR